MKRPSTVADGGQSVIIPAARIQTTPASGISPSARESTRIMGRKLPPLLFRFVCRTCFALFTPELVTRAADKYVLQRGFAHRYRLNLAGKGLDHIGDEPVPALAFNTNLIS